MTISREDLKAALAQLDTSNDEHWTDDGSPRVSVVRLLAKDDTIVRATINDLVPGFVRPGIDGIVKPDPNAEVVLKTDADLDPLSEPEIDPASGEKLSADDVRAILERRVSKASEAIDDAQANIKAANLELRQAQERHAKCLRDLNTRFPPLSFAENIKQHLASQQRQREEAAGVFRSPLDENTSLRVAASRKQAAAARYSPHSA